MSIINKAILFSILFIIGCSNRNSASNKNTTNSTSNTVLKKGQSAVIDNDSDANVLQIAKSLDDFTTLVVAIEAAGVEDAIVNAGPLTVFAPLNSAFNKLPEGTVSSLLETENLGKLAFILTHHVAPANFPDTQLEKEVKKGRKLYMASGKYLDVLKKEDGIYVGGTKILKTVKASNGWIHVIDDVLLPQD